MPQNSYRYYGREDINSYWSQNGQYNDSCGNSFEKKINSLFGGPQNFAESSNEAFYKQYNSFYNQSYTDSQYNNYYKRSNSYDYRNHRQKPYDSKKRKYFFQKRNNNSYKANNPGNCQKAGAQEHKKNSDVDPQTKLLSALNKTAKAIRPVRNNTKELSIPIKNSSKPLHTKVEMIKNVVQSVMSTEQGDKENSEKDNNNELTPVKTSKLDFKTIVEEHENAFKTMKYLFKMDERREEYIINNENNKVGTDYDTKTVRCVRLFQTREDLICRAKESRLYKAAQEEIKKNGTQVLKTPEVAIESSRWIENYFKPWKLDLSRMFYHCLEDSDQSITEDNQAETS